MAATCRLDQKITGDAKWVNPDGSPVSPTSIAPFTGDVSDPSVATLVVFGDGSFQVNPLAVGDVTVTITDANGDTASDTVTVTPKAPLAGSIAWSAPFPA